MQSRTYVYQKGRNGEPDDVRLYSAKTIHNVHGEVISPALAYAARDGGHIPANPCVGVILPEKAGRSVTRECVPMGEEIEQWITIGYSVSELAGDIISLALGTGLRWGEMVALRPCDVDLERGLLTVAQVIKRDENHRSYIASYGKSDKALRTIRIPANLIEMFRRRIEGAPAKGLIFRAARGGILHYSVWYSNHWRKVIKKAAEQGVSTKASAHKFRHAHATALLAVNVSLDTVSKRLGHASIVITSDLYSHLDPGADQIAAEAIERVMSGGARSEGAATAKSVA